MALPAMKLHSEVFVEPQPGKLESDVQHILATQSEMKTDIRELRKGIERLDQRVDAVKDNLSGKIESVNKTLSDKIENVTEKLSKFAIWAVLLYCALGGTLLAVIAHGFKWI